MLFSNKKKQATDTCYKMNESQKTIVLKERNQTQEIVYHMIPCIRTLRRANIQLQKAGQHLPGPDKGRSEGWGKGLGIN